MFITLLLATVVAESFVPLDDSNETVYVVKSGDTLSAIALKYQTTVAAICSLNGISDPNKISVGQKIRIPGGTPTPSTCTTYYVTCDSLNVRTSPSTSGALAGSLSKGQSCCVVSITSGWAKLNTGNYVSAQYLTTTKPGPAPTPVAGDKRKCKTFWNNYNGSAYPTRAQYGQGLRSLVGKHVDYTQGGSRWNGINKGFCPGSVPDWADCSSFTTWAYWTAFGGMSDIVNGEGWRAGYTGTMQSKGTKIAMSSCQPGDVILYTGHVASYVGNNQIVNFGATGPVKLLAANYRSGGGCYRYNFPFGQQL